MPSIVQISISQQSGAAPITLQGTGAFVSQGGTSLSSGSYSLLTGKSDLTPLLASPLALSSLTWSGGSVVATTAAPIPGLVTGDTFPTTIAGAAPAGYNGLVLATVTGASTFTFPLASNPGTETVAGTYTPPGQGELVAMVQTFFGQGTSRGVYVLELGAGDGNTGPAALGAFETANPDFFYSYLVPRGWDAKAGYLALVAQFNSLSAKKYFFTTTTTGTYTAYPATDKCVLAAVEAPGIPLTEFSVATAFQKTLAYAPSSTNRMTPLAYSFLFGVTSYPTKNNSALLTTLDNANISFVQTGAEGGISNTILSSGDTLDGKDFSYWYSVDWIQLNESQAIANEIINGSNNSINPLWYDQPGIDRLQDRAFGVVKSAITFALATGTVTRSALSATEFATALDNGDFDGQNVV
ncbi:MAG TPA: hypothetical protein VI653_14995, partial [Steroidobacteraceae bacterium]